LTANSEKEQKTMEHKGTKQLETQRLILRRYTLADAAAMYRNWASDANVTKYLTWPPHADVSVTEGLLREWVAQYDDPSMYHWAIVFKPFSTEEPVGDISVVELKSDIQMAHIGYCLGKPWWHQGIMSEALRRVMDYLFDEVGFNRLESRHDPRNPHSGDVMKKCGMRYEGTRRQGDRNNQGLCDAAFYAILADEWKLLSR